MLPDYKFSGRMQITRASVVTESLPAKEDIVL